VIKDFKTGFRFSLNETIVEITILELGNNKVLGLICNNNKILIGITLYKLSHFFLVFENLV
jgi:hypothetical protein